MKCHELKIEIKLLSPFLFPTEQSGASEFDTIALRASDSKPIIPQDQLRGVMRHALKEVALSSDALDESDINHLFGLGSSDARDADADQVKANYEPNRGVIYFSDLCAEKKTETGKATRICIDPETGAVDTGSLFSVELVAPLGCEISFSGTAQLYATDENATKWINALNAANTWVSAIGSMKTAGFGEVIKFSISREASQPLIANKVVEAVSGKATYSIEIDRPFLVDAERAANNIFIGKEVIPGGVIKGALARKLQLDGSLKKLSKALTTLKISHARVANVTPTIPLSWYIETSKDDRSAKDALSLDPTLLNDLVGSSLLFYSDWKPADEALIAAKLKITHAPHLGRDIRTHAKIDQKSGTAEDQKLYVSSAVIPGGHVWDVDVDYSKIIDAEQKLELQRALEDGLFGVGQTGSTLLLRRQEAQQSASVRPYADNRTEFAIVLQSDAVMCDRITGSAFDSYRKYWNRVLPEATLQKSFAGQKLAGGYLARRFQLQSIYNPFVLTQTGSVFLLKGEIKEALEKLIENGLPAPFIDGEQTTWENCPFQPENGYGQIFCYSKEMLE